MDHFKTTRSFYRRIVKPVIQYSTKRRIDILLEFVKDKRVLDLGCVEHQAKIEEKVDWWLHGLVKQKASEVVGVDYDSTAINELKQRGYNVRVADVENMQLNERFDLVLAGELFEHLTNHRSFII